MKLQTNRKKNCDFPHNLEINEESLTNPIGIVNNLNPHFSNIGKKIV